MPSSIRVAMWLLALAVLFIIAYEVILKGCTVIDPQKGTTRFQIGFGKADWSLTERGLYWKAKDPLVTAQEMMLAEAAFVDGGPEKLWTPLSINIAGVLTTLVYFVGFICCTISVGLLASHRVKSESEVALDRVARELSSPDS